MNPPPLPRPARRPWSLGEILAWAAILLLVAFVAWRAALAQMHPADGATDLSLKYVAQYVLGVHWMYAPDSASAPAASAPAEAPPSAPAPAPWDSNLLAQLDGAAKTPESRLRTAIVAGEFRGTDEALARLAALKPTDPALQRDVRTASAIYRHQHVPDEDWAAFHLQYGWFADLLASHGQPAADPLRAQTVQRAYLTVALTFGLFAVAALLTIAGLVLFIIAMVRLAKGRIKTTFSPVNADVAGPLAGPSDIGETTPAPPALNADRRVYLYGFAIYLLGMVGFGLALRYLLGQSMAVGLLALVAAFVLGVSLPLFWGESLAHWRMALGLHTGRGFWREIAGGVLGYLAGMPIMALGLVVVIGLSALTGIKGTHPIVEELQGSPWELAMVFFLASVYAPVTEELMFRGALLAHFRERYQWLVSAPAVAVVFAIIHPQGWIALPVLAAIAIVLAGIREWRGSIIGCMAAHSLHNTLAMIVAVLLLR